MSRFICWLLGHRPVKEKEFWTCRRCHGTANGVQYNPVSKPQWRLPLWKRKSPMNGSSGEPSSRRQENGPESRRDVGER